jgi:hypothetical protein
MMARLGWATVVIASIVVVGGVLTAFAGGLLLSSEGQTIAVALSTFVVFTLFQPVRAHLQRGMDRRFDRARFDADRTAVAFADRLRDEVDIAAVTKDLSSTVHEVVRPASLGLWLRGSNHRAGAE